jgi:hypothetical protein
LACRGKALPHKEAIADFLRSEEEMEALHEGEGWTFPELEFERRYDAPTFLSCCAGALRMEKATGVSQRQRSHYANGVKRPRPKTAQKVERAPHTFSEKLEPVRFYVQRIT